MKRGGASLVRLLALLGLALIPVGAAPPSAAAPSAAPSAPVPPPPADIDAESEPIVRALTDAMGGQATWDKLPNFRFDFVVIRDGKESARYKHWWDKRRGRCRVEGPDGQGRKVVAIFDLSDRKGIAFSDGVGETDPARVTEILTFGYERWVNDTYWVMMPFKLRDPGVRIRYARPERTPDGEYDVLELSFVKGTGLTSDDRYWLHVNRATRLIDRWEYVLTGRQPPPQAVAWEAWSRIGPIRLSLQRRVAGRPQMIRFENVATPAAFDET
ncbi:MAG TPA: hypothetical protein VFT32_10915, partial [Candidatus Eisenbacteria bacterium]|nr:hypothetical protein [Candidatus Eisenbacteria bacterium]